MSSFQRTNITKEECLAFVVASRTTRQSTLVPCIKIPPRIATTLHTERRSQLYDSKEQNCEPPQPSMTWRDTCVRIQYKDLVSGEVLLNELQTEAAKIKSLHTVQSAVISFFEIDNWDQANERFGSAVDAEKLVRFTGNFEPSHDFQVFLRRLKDRENQEIEEPSVEDADEFTINLHGTFSKRNIYNRGSNSCPARGYIHHKKATNNGQGITMQEVVSAFVVGHWAISRIVGSRHVNLTCSHQQSSWKQPTQKLENSTL
ncbi:uncharacterized protein [Montipora capricornis]|uniref:uncharacterized protein n=1 Tax=Montipora capricornis TaxID=246305 RepID=UPI0035F1B3B1